MNSLPITSRDDASGSTRENTRLEEELVVVGAGVDRVRALLEGDELGDRARPRRAHHHAEVGQAAHEQRVAGAEEVVGRRVELGERDHERGRVLAPVGPRAAGSRKCSTTATSGPGVSISV